MLGLNHTPGGWRREQKRGWSKRKSCGSASCPEAIPCNAFPQTPGHASAWMSGCPSTQLGGRQRIGKGLLHGTGPPRVVRASSFCLTGAQKHGGLRSEDRRWLKGRRRCKLPFVLKEPSLSLVALAWSMMEKGTCAKSLRATSCPRRWQDATGSSPGHPVAASTCTDF